MPKFPDKQMNYRAGYADTADMRSPWQGRCSVSRRFP